MLVGSFVANRFQSGHRPVPTLVTTYLLITNRRSAGRAVAARRSARLRGATGAGAATAMLFLTLMTRGGPRSVMRLASLP